MGFFTSKARAADEAASDTFDKVDARLEALSLAGKRPVGKRPSLFATVKTQPTLQEA
jgi:hypothetical protein